MRDIFSNSKVYDEFVFYAYEFKEQASTDF